MIRELGLYVRIVGKPEKTDIIIALRSRRKDHNLRQLSRLAGVPIYLIKRNTTAEIRRLLQKVFNVVQGIEEAELQKALLETQSAIDRVMKEGVKVALAPRRPALRKVQHRLISGRGLESTSVGCEPKRHLVVYPVGG